MAEHAYTFEEINAAVEKFDLAKHQAGVRQISAEAAKNPALALPQLCPIYKVIRPILVVLSGLILIPQKWRDLIKGLISVLDALCP